MIFFYYEMVLYIYIAILEQVIQLEAKQMNELKNVIFFLYHLLLFSNY